MKNEKKLHEFSYTQNIANFESFFWNLNLSTNRLFWRYVPGPFFSDQIFLATIDEPMMILELVNCFFAKQKPNSKFIIVSEI